MCMAATSNMGMSFSNFRARKARAAAVSRAPQVSQRGGQARGHLLEAADGDSGGMPPAASAAARAAATLCCRLPGEAPLSPWSALCCCSCCCSSACSDSGGRGGCHRRLVLPPGAEASRPCPGRDPA